MEENPLGPLGLDLGAEGEGRGRGKGARTSSKTRLAVALPSLAEIRALNSAAEDRAGPARQGTSPSPDRIPERPARREGAAQPASPHAPVPSPGAGSGAAGVARAPRTAPPATRDLWLLLKVGIAAPAGSSGEQQRLTPSPFSPPFPGGL